MAPKSMSQAQKIEKFLAFFHETRTCHTLKDLESSAPAATKINKVQIKDLLKELTDTNQVKVEKIGSGNWYWSWPGEELNEKTNLIEKLRAEESILNENITRLQLQLEQQQSKQTAAKSHSEYDVIVGQLQSLEAEVNLLITERNEWEVAVDDGIDSKRSAIMEFKGQAATHTDNILALEAYLQRQLPVSHEEMENLRRECYGRLYREGRDITHVDEQ